VQIRRGDLSRTCFGKAAKGVSGAVTLLPKVSLLKAILGLSNKEQRLTSLRIMVSSLYWELLAYRNLPAGNIVRGGMAVGHVHGLAHAAHAAQSLHRASGCG
jgi:hypothetical protein